MNDSFGIGIISEVVSKRKSRKLKRWFSDVKFCMATESKTPVYLIKKVMKCFYCNLLQSAAKKTVENKTMMTVEG